MSRSLERGGWVLEEEMRAGGTQKLGFWNSSKSEFQDLCLTFSPASLYQEEDWGKGGWRRNQTTGLVPK